MVDEKDNITLNEIIGGFLEAGGYLTTADEEAAARRIFSGDKFIEKYLEYTGISFKRMNRPVKKDTLKEPLKYAIKEFVRSYSRDKDAVIEILKKFAEYLKKEHDIKLNMQWPPVRLADADARRRYMVEYLQENRKDFEKLSEELWVSDRTLENDYRYISGSAEDGMTVGGLPFAVPDITRANSRIEFDSTASIVEFAANVSEVIAVLEGLRMADENPYHRHKAERMARIIWQQLSIYTRDRLWAAAEDGTYDCNLNWLEKLDNSSEEESFRTETEYIKNFEDKAKKGDKATDPKQKFAVLAHCMKNGINMRIEYREGSGEINVYECRTKDGRMETDSICVGVSESPEKEMKVMAIENIVSVCRM